MALDLWQETRKLLQALKGIDYAVIGAVALAVHGVPRATTDIDLLVRPEDVQDVLAKARAVGFSVEAFPMRFSDGVEVRRTTKIDDDGDTLTLDLLLVDENLEPIWETRLRVEADVGDVWVISREALIKMKTWAGRERDIGDIRSLEELDR